MKDDSNLYRRESLAVGVLELEHSDVFIVVLADDFSRQRGVALVAERDAHIVSARDDCRAKEKEAGLRRSEALEGKRAIGGERTVRVGDDVAGAVPDEATASALRRLEFVKGEGVAADLEVGNENDGGGAGIEDVHCVLLVQRETAPGRARKQLLRSERGGAAHPARRNCNQSRAPAERCIAAFLLWLRRARGGGVG